MPQSPQSPQSSQSPESPCCRHHHRPSRPSRLRGALAVVGAAVALVAGVDAVSYAATGKPLLLGRANKAPATTTLTAPGTPLSLKGAAARPPLKVNSSTKVRRLNADLLDGLDAAALRTTARVFTRSLTDVTATTTTVPIAPGSYLVSYSHYFPVTTLGTTRGRCFLVADTPSGTRYLAEQIGTDPQGGPIGVSGSALVTLEPEGELDLRCSTPLSYSTTASQPQQVVAVPVDSVSTTVLP
ncbi:hypothetical protein [Nocardioides sp.]|uniref:hypothetical protein n=1 Tax=Nocardioides sp. TaxID=35761 RepID=UPI00351519E8